MPFPIHDKINTWTLFWLNLWEGPSVGSPMAGLEVGVLKYHKE